ncbi:hypothetical protein IW152_003155 [Coemansia sp. BCRC 34962]|nr:hypothetical protein IW152_003155 [Coemansia sp. BCRC 34962]
MFQDIRRKPRDVALGGPRIGTQWSPEEDDALRTAVAMYGEGKWILIAEFVGTRTNHQCASHWRCLSTPLSGKSLPAMHWARVAQKESRLKMILNVGELSNAELSMRSAVVATILQQQQDSPNLLDRGRDKRSWGLSSERLRVATAKVDHLDGRALLEPFSPEEDGMIVRLFRLYGGRWTYIANLVSAAHPNHSEQMDSQAWPKQKRTPLGVKTRLMALVRAHNSSLQKEAPSKAYDNTALTVSGLDKPVTKRTLRAWTTDEDADLEAVVGSMVRDRAGFLSWAEVSRQLSTQRSPWQCRIRWTQHISSHIQHTPFTKAEDRLLWPFVIDAGQRPFASKGRTGDRGKPITIKYTNAKGRLTDVGMGWLGAGLMAGRATSALRIRVGRLQHVIEWMRKVAGIKDAHLHFDMVHRLANTPSDFRINTKRRVS